MNSSDRQVANGANTARRRGRKTRRSVVLANRVAHVLITFGGVSTIAAVSLVCVFLVWVVVPLFLPARMVTDSGTALPPQASAADEQIRLDEYLTTAWTLDALGVARAIRLETGDILAELRPFGDAPPTTLSPVSNTGFVAAGFADGSVRYGTISFATSFVDTSELPVDIQSLEPGETAAHGDGMVERTPEGQFRLQRLTAEIGEPVEVEAGARIVAIDASQRTNGLVIVALSSTGKLHIDEVKSKRNLLTNKTTVTLRGGEVDVPESARGGAPRWLRLAGLGDNVYLVWPDGRLLRYDVRNVTEPRFAESVLLAEEPGIGISALDFVIGKTSLVSGDEAGRVRVWFRTQQPDAGTPDGTSLALAHEFQSAHGSVTALTPSARSRMIVAGYADGTVRILHVTSGRLVADAQAGTGSQTVDVLALSPKDNALLAVAGSQSYLWSVNAPHPEITLSAIFAPVWYEGAPSKAHVWQSSSGTDDFEPKYGLYPLIFGTLKATLYSMLFGVPVALLAAIYSSEMMHARTRARVKPMIEMMASLPSVVLGFLAALVVAPFIEDIVTESLLCFVTMPFTILLGAHAWQLLPRRFATRNERYRIGMIALSLSLGLWLAVLAGPLTERALFAGNIKVWLDGQVGTGTGAWMFVLLPLSCLASAMLSTRYAAPWVRACANDWTEFQLAGVQLLKFLGLSLMSLAIAYVTSYVLANGPLGLWEIDPRGGFVSTYVQRNSLVVGFIMGFAIIPIIYTISEDALSAVPDHLRTASLGAGATPWQTATRIIVPTAASGLFSAVMIGFGRAVGETMIVLMAAGNTPVMEWNVFNGFRTLSANIAVELPEAVKDSTHYRMLFLAALCLFVITFVLNTVAESIRQRFRRRAFKV